MKKCLILTLVLCVLAACGGEPSPTPDLVATQIAVEIAAHATMTAWVPTATSTPEPAATATATEPPAPTSVPSHTPSPGPTVTPPPIIEAEEYAVYSALIEQNPIGYNLGSTLVIRDQTTVLDAEQFKRTLEHVPALPGALADSYRSRNAASYTLSPNLELEQDYVLVPPEEYDEALAQRGGALGRVLSRDIPSQAGWSTFPAWALVRTGTRPWCSWGFAAATCAGRAGSTSWSRRRVAGRSNRR